MRRNRPQVLAAALAFAPILALPGIAVAQTVSNPSTAPDCMNNTAFYNPALPPSINLPPGFTASVFAKNLNMPTGIAFLGDAANFQVFVLESGHGLPSVCNDEMAWPGGPFDINNPFTPDILVFNRNGTLIRGPLGKPTSSGEGSSHRDRRSTSPSSKASQGEGSSRPIPINQPISTMGTTTVHASSP